MAPAKIFRIKDGAESSIGITITELPGVRAENLGLKTWGAAWILSNRVYALHKYAQRPESSEKDELDVLEIGAGTGLSGLAAAAIWRCRVVLTDLPSIVEALDANAKLNLDLLRQRQAQVECGTLDWFDPKNLHLYNATSPLQSSSKSFQIILAADTLYFEDHPQLMADTIFEWLAPNKEACFIVCYAQRIAYLDHIRELWTLLEQGGLQSVEEGLEHGDESWDEEAPFEWAVFKWKRFLVST